MGNACYHAVKNIFVLSKNAKTKIYTIIILPVAFFVWV
jgi:hypothetical protein